MGQKYSRLPSPMISSRPPIISPLDLSPVAQLLPPLTGGYIVKPRRRRPYRKSTAKRRSGRRRVGRPRGSRSRRRLSYRKSGRRAGRPRGSKNRRGNRKLYTGPNGGKYYISNGRHVYV